jgi:hypothetical protein
MQFVKAGTILFTSAKAIGKDAQRRQFVRQTGEIPEPQSLEFFQQGLLGGVIPRAYLFQISLT